MANLKKGSRGSGVRAVKDRLYELGYLKVKPTHDSFGSDTERAVKAFQAAVGITADGIVGKVTQAKLEAAKKVDMPIEKSPAKAAENAENIAKREQMLDIIETRVGDEYIWGAQGNIPTADYVDKRARAKPDKVTPTRAARFKLYAKENPVKANGEVLRAEDCSGLFWAAENIVELPLDKNKDIDDSTAAGLYRYYCYPVDKKDLQPLDLVFSGDPITHVGIVGRGGKIYEAAGSEIGVVVNDNVDVRTMKSIYGREYGCAETYRKAPWTKFGRLKIYKDV